MLDLGKLYGTYKGITFYGDHEDESLVYYLPDEVRLDKDKNSHYEMDLMFFRESNIVSTDAINMDDIAGSILQLGVICTVDERRLSRALDELKDNVKTLPENLKVTQPVWKEGTVDMMILDRQKSQETNGDNTGFVKSIIGSQRPSYMTNDLKSIFNVRLNQRGTEIVYDSLKGGTSSLAGIMYDLKYNALQPAADLRISANLSKCQETVQHELKAKVTYQDESINVTAEAELGWLTQKMEENGDIKVEVLSMVETEEDKKRIHQLVQEFKDKVLEELFTPQINTNPPDKTASIEKIGEAVGSTVDKIGENAGKIADKVMGNGGGGDDSSSALSEITPSIKVSYKFKKEKIEENKTLVVDYRERTTVVKTHNPQSHLWVFGLQLGNKFSDYITQVELGDLWKTQNIHTNVEADTFDSTGLKFAEVAFWKQELGVNTTKPATEFAIPDGVSPLVAMLTKEHPEMEISWTRNDKDEAGYYYQVRFGYENEEIVSEPLLSYSGNLMIVPELCIFNRKLHVMGCGINYDVIRNVDVRLDITDPAGTRPPQFLLLSADHNEDTLLVRSRYRDKTSIQMTRTIDLNNGTKISSESSVFGSEIPVYNPLLNRELTLVFSGVTDEINSVMMDVAVKSALFTGELKYRFVFNDLTAVVTDVAINILDENDEVSYKLNAITSSGDVIPLEGGVAGDEPIAIKLAGAISDKPTNLSIEWDGKSPEDADIKRVEVYIKEEDKDEIKYEFKGSSVPEPIQLKISIDADVTVRIEKRFFDGHKDIQNNVPVQEGKIIVHCP